MIRLGDVHLADLNEERRRRIFVLRSLPSTRVLELVDRVSATTMARVRLALRNMI